MELQHRPLLGRLANRWFNEVIATDALRLVLDDPMIRSAFLTFVGRSAGVDLSEIRAFERERPTIDGRIDLEGVDRQGRPRLVIEAKFAHLMSDEQMSRYLVYQRRELDDGDLGVQGVLLLLVPASRLDQAQAIMGYLRAALAADPSDGQSVTALALSWEDCLAAIEDSVRDDPPKLMSPAADVVQLRSLCEGLGGWAVPLIDVPKDAHWDYLMVVLDRLQDRVPQRYRGPLVVKDPDYQSLRYYGVPGYQAAYSIGLAFHLDGEISSPVWMRFHKKTPDFREVKKLLRRSQFSEQIRDFRGHVWLPLAVEAGLAGPELMEHLAAQVEAIMQVFTSGGRVR